MATLPSSSLSINFECCLEMCLVIPVVFLCNLGTGDLIYGGESNSLDESAIGTIYFFFAPGIRFSLGISIGFFDILILVPLGGTGVILELNFFFSSSDEEKLSMKSAILAIPG